MLDQLAIGAPPPNVATTVEPSSAEPYWLLRSGPAKKLGKQSKGSIAYQLLTNDARQEVWLTISSNDGGGYFSQEMVALASVQTCVSDIKPQEPFPSKLLQAAFTGRSSNNAGFLAAILRQESLLGPAPETEGKHILSGDWTAWKAALLALPGTPAEITDIRPAT
ncbi:MAG: hypothetical protein EOO38_14235, partial [Cytophagaceae bacterium]